MNSDKGILHEIRAFINFFSTYIKTRGLFFGLSFEKIKDLIVSLLIVKRGKYSQSFLNTTFFLMVGATVIAGPVIAENNPFIAGYLAQNQASSSSQSNVLATDINSLPFDTTISQKPRDKVNNYKVESGDTLASIAKKFDISVDTIKWANDLKGDTINPGDTLKIPPVTGVVHKVESGDTIYSVAKKYGVDAQAIANFPFNDFADPDNFTLTVGQTLIVPNGTPPEVKQVVPQYYAQSQIYTPPPGATSGSGSFIWPTQGIITQYPIWYHMAFDIANNALPPVWASDAGTVVAAGWDVTGYGNKIMIDHGNGFETLYGHLSQINVSLGQSVSRGQVIGRMGSTGNSTGPHLHFEIRSGGRKLNPAQYVHP